MLPFHIAQLTLDNGLGLTPRLAYSTWNFFGTSATEADVRDTAAALEQTGLRALGFDTVNIDAGSVDRDPTTGRLVPSKHRFPSGLRNLSDYLHIAGFRFGAYNDISGHTCGNGPAAGSLHHYDLDAATFAHEWQVDYLKFDFCGVQMPGAKPENCTGVVGRSCGTVPVEASAQLGYWAALSQAVNRTGRPIYLDFCPHAVADGVGTEVPKGKLLYSPPKEWSLAQRRALSNSLLVEYDNTVDAWNYRNSSGLIFNIDAMLQATDLSYSAPGAPRPWLITPRPAPCALRPRVTALTQPRPPPSLGLHPAPLPGAWNYGDMLQVCGYGKGRTPGGGMSLAEYRAHYSVWAILASPLVLGTDLRSLASDHPDCLALLLNKDIVAVNQDAGGLPPRLVAQTPPFGSAAATTLAITMQAFARPLSGGRLAVLLLNRAPAAARLSASWAELGIAAGRRAAVYDVLTHASRGAVAGSFQADVPSHDVAFVILQPEAGAPPLHTESNVVIP